MKKLLSLSVLALFGASIFTSCLNDDSNAAPLSYGILKIDSVAMPDTAALGIPVKITPHISIKKGCQSLQDLSYQISGEKERKVMAIGVQEMDADCSKAETAVISPSFTFQPIDEGTYTFKFLQDQEKDEKGDYKDIYLSKKIVIKR